MIKKSPWNHKTLHIQLIPSLITICRAGESILDILGDYPAMAGCTPLHQALLWTLAQTPVRNGAQKKLYGLIQVDEGALTQSGLSDNQMSGQPPPLGRLPLSTPLSHDSTVPYFSTPCSCLPGHRVHLVSSSYPGAQASSLLRLYPNQQGAWPLKTLVSWSVKSGAQGKFLLPFMQI